MVAKSTKSAGTVGIPSAEQKAIAALTFEAASADLDALVSRMERGDLALEESITAYQRGVALAAHCETLLAHAQQRVQVLQDGVLSNYSDGDAPTAST